MNASSSRRIAASRSFSVYVSCQAEEVEEVRVAEDQVGRQPVLVAQGGEFLHDQLVGLLADSAVRSKSMRRSCARSVRELHRSTRHISA